MYKINIIKESSSYADDYKIHYIETKEAETKKEANQIKKALINKYELKKHWRDYINYSTSNQLYTNF